MLSTYNVRVVNLSIGVPAINSYKFDPLCVAARTLVDRGIVVVAAAGNNGKNSCRPKGLWSGSFTRQRTVSDYGRRCRHAREPTSEATTRSRPTARVVRRAVSGPIRQRRQPLRQSDQTGNRSAW